MARRIADRIEAQLGLRARLLRAARAELDRLSASVTDLYDFSLQRSGLRQRIADLESGADVQLHRFGDGVPRDVWPEGSRLAVLVGDELHPADDQIIRVTSG